MNTLPLPSTVSPVKQVRPAIKQTLSGEWPGVASARSGPTCSPSPGSVTDTPNRSAPSEWSGCAWVSTTPARPSGAAARTASKWPASSGPGSTTQPSIT